MLMLLLNTSPHKCYLCFVGSCSAFHCFWTDWVCFHSAWQRFGQFPSEGSSRKNILTVAWMQCFLPLSILSPFAFFHSLSLCLSFFRFSERYNNSKGLQSNSISFLRIKTFFSDLQAWLNLDQIALLEIIKYPFSKRKNVLNIVV